MNTLWREREILFLSVCVCVFVYSCGHNCCLGVCGCECVCVNEHMCVCERTHTAVRTHPPKRRNEKILFHLCLFHLDEIFNTINMVAVKNYHVINK